MGEKVKIKLPKDWKKTEARYLTSTQVAHLCGVSHSTIFRAIKDGAIKKVQTPGGHYRIDRKDAIDYINHLGIKPGEKILALIASL